VAEPGAIIHAGEAFKVEDEVRDPESESAMYVLLPLYAYIISCNRCGCSQPRRIQPPRGLIPSHYNTTFAPENGVSVLSEYGGEIDYDDGERFSGYEKRRHMAQQISTRT
jgi:hypothetical protein